MNTWIPLSFSVRHRASAVLPSSVRSVCNYYLFYFILEKYQFFEQARRNSRNAYRETYLIVNSSFTSWVTSGHQHWPCSSDRGRSRAGLCPIRAFSSHEAARPSISPPSRGKPANLILMNKLFHFCFVIQRNRKWASLSFTTKPKALRARGRQLSSFRLKKRINAVVAHLKWVDGSLMGLSRILEFLLLLLDSLLDIRSNLLHFHLQTEHLKKGGIEMIMEVMR